MILIDNLFDRLVYRFRRATREASDESYLGSNGMRGRSSKVTLSGAGRCAHWV